MFLSTRDYGFLGEWTLLTYDHPAEWVQSKPIKTKIFKAKGLPVSEYGLGDYQHL